MWLRRFIGSACQVALNGASLHEIFALENLDYTTDTMFPFLTIPVRHLGNIEYGKEKIRLGDTDPTNHSRKGSLCIDIIRPSTSVAAASRCVSIRLVCVLPVYLYKYMEEYVCTERNYYWVESVLRSYHNYYYQLLAPPLSKWNCFIRSRTFTPTIIYCTACTTCNQMCSL